jgi:hypothetical protein
MSISSRINFFSLTAVYFGLYIWQLENTWIFLGRTEINFGDLGYVIKCGDSNNLQSDFFSHNNCPDYMYGSLILRIIEILGVTSNIIYPLGIFFIASLSAIFSYLSTSANNRLFSFIVGALIMISPPIELIIQRGNLDSFMFISVFVSSTLIAKKRFGIALLLLSISSLFKFYTLPLLIWSSLLFVHKSNKKMISQSYLFVISIICVIDILNINRFPSDAQNFFGAPIFGEYLTFIIYGSNSHGDPLLSTALGAILYLLASFLLFRLSKHKTIFPAISDISSNRTSLVIFVFNLLTFLSCYFAGLNIDYRLIFIAATTLSFLNLKFQSSFNFKYLLAFALFVILYTSYNTYVLQPIGDVFILFMISYFTIFFIIERAKIIDSIFVKR